MSEPTHAHLHHLRMASDRAIAEALNGCAEHNPFNSWHEAYAVLKEEVDELWEEIKKRSPDRLAITRESKQIAGIALRISAWASRGNGTQPEDEDAELQSRLPEGAYTTLSARHPASELTGSERVAEE